MCERQNYPFHVAVRLSDPKTNGTLCFFLMSKVPCRYWKKNMEEREKAMNEEGRANLTTTTTAGYIAPNKSRSLPLLVFSTCNFHLPSSSFIHLHSIPSSLSSSCSPPAEIDWMNASASAAKKGEQDVSGKQGTGACGPAWLLLLVDYESRAVIIVAAFLATIHCHTFHSLTMDVSRSVGWLQWNKAQQMASFIHSFIHSLPLVSLWGRENKKVVVLPTNHSRLKSTNGTYTKKKIKEN